MRWSGMGTRRPPACRRSASERVAFQRQRFVKSGEARAAWTRSSCSVSRRTIANTESSGKLCCSPSEMTRPSSVAAACSSKLKVTQKRLRSARPQARLMRPPKGACTTSCMPPASSKKRSATTQPVVGTVPSAASVAPT